MLRTHTCGELGEKHVGAEVALCGWVDTIRDHGGLTFLDLRDRYGKTQVVVKSVAGAEARGIKTEDCVLVEGAVRVRPKGTENPKLATGRIEVADARVTLINPCEPTPFEVGKSLETNEDLRMKFRFLDLRNPSVQSLLFARHRLYQAVRRSLDRHGFIEVETPILTKSTPEGARDYLVPSRLNPGEFYALPQSPQLFKQILMVSGLDRYFQIAKCFRDEDLRADRQPEFTQLDIEMSFLDEDDLFIIIEEVMKDIFDALGKKLKTPFPRLTYQQAMERYGTDKPDLRFGLEFVDASALVKDTEFKVFKDKTVIGICVPGAGAASRKDTDTLTEFVKGEGGAGLVWFKVAGGKLDSPVAKFFPEDLQKKFIAAFSADEGDLILLIADEASKARRLIGVLRLHAARWKGLIPRDVFHFSWVTDFPLFKYNDQEKRWESEHHPFTAPNAEDWEKYGPAAWDKIRSRAYDLVLNGNEIASGSVRIHSSVLQNQIFEAIGLGAEEIKQRFGFLLGAFKFGAPPHGGIALGLDRVLAILLGLESIREVIAFPKNQKGVDPMNDAPGPVAEKQLKELGIKLR